ncbi:ComF family protein [Streptomyces sp. NPDC002790]|uniref:ComF family protein n=1 Tax=Streptomyces sp. NPDC002790 TaxID=3154431 RepID=UPI00331C2ECE
MRGWWQDLSDLVLPAECAGCGRSRTTLCERCSAALRGAVPSRVRPWPAPPGMPVVFGAVPYRNAVRAVLLAHKERGALGLARPLGEALAGAVRSVLAEGGDEWGGAGGRAAGGAVGPVTLVPVPSAPRAVRARGHDPTRRIAYAAAAELRRAGVAARVLAVLRQRRAVADQSGLDARQRLVNVTGALEVVGGGSGLLTGNGRIVLVDDLITTGASLAEAARAIAVATGYVKIEREGGSERGRAGAGRGKVGEIDGIMFRAAVVAASPDSFEINRN